MNIVHLRLQNFRNIKDLALEFNGKKIGFLGENAQGKTNILEGLYVLSRGESWRAVLDSDLISSSAAFSRIDGTVFPDKDKNELAIVIEKDEDTLRLKKSYLVNDIKRKKETFTKYFPVVLFSPEDISLIVGSPSARRKALDACLCEAYPHYGHLISQYGKIIVSRNKLLERIRAGQATVNQLEYWTQAMLQLGSEIYKYRYQFFYFLNDKKEDHSIIYFPKISCEMLALDTAFVSEIGKIYSDRVKANADKEIMSATSQYGPHKDDYCFFLKEKNLSLYGSRGEQRAALFFFKKAQLLYIEEAREMKPVLLLDDVFSEFDRVHRTELSLLTEGYQTFVTGTEEEFFMHEEFGFDLVFQVKEGTVFVK